MLQIVVCQNVATGKGMVQGVMTHEMIHMFDYCRNELDFKNIDHLACTEIRAANLAHCSFLSAWSQGNASLFNIKEAHQVIIKLCDCPHDRSPLSVFLLLNKILINTNLTLSRYTCTNSHQQNFHNADILSTTIFKVTSSYVIVYCATRGERR